MKSLAGRRVVVTRAAPVLEERLRAAGATVIEVPTIAIGPPPDTAPLARALAGLDACDWVVFTSANAVRAVGHALRASGGSLPARLKIASVGPATSSEVEEAWPGRRPDLEPPAEYSGEGLLAAWPEETARGARILLPVSDRASDTVERGLAARGAVVVRVVAYTTATDPSHRAAWEQAASEGVDLVVFLSPSAVEGFLALAGSAAAGVPAAVIGPTTATRARTGGLRVLVQPDRSTLEALAAAVEGALRAS